jgi:uncharacterized protein YbjT (DUF2867 family)
MKIFVAGGPGVLGRSVVRALVEAGHHVRSTARGKEKADLVQQKGWPFVASHLAARIA